MICFRLRLTPSEPLFFSCFDLMKWKGYGIIVLVWNENLNERSNDKVKKMYAWEPWFFIVFGLFHLHRVWALLDRGSYAAFWMGILNSKGAAYFLIMGALAVLCVTGIIAFFKNRKQNYWWRWVYIFGGGYVLFDLFAIATGLKQWNRLLQIMFDTASPYWNAVWSFFIILGGLSFSLGVYLLYKRKRRDENERITVSR